MPMHLRFGRTKPKTPAELVSRTNTALSYITSGKQDRATEKAVEDVARYLEQIKVGLLGHDDEPADKEYARLLNMQAIEHDLVRSLLKNLQSLEFETRKDVGLVIAAFLRIGTPYREYPMADYVAKEQEVISLVVQGYQNHTDPHIGLISGGILRDCIKHEKLAKLIAESEFLVELVDYILGSKFEVGADAICTLKDLLTKHKDLMAEVLIARYDEIIPQIHTLVESDNFFVKRQSLKLLGEILLEPKNSQLTAKYVKYVQNLILLMNLLKDKYESIQFEAFHSFKVFLLGSSKAPEVLEILKNNKQKLLNFLQNFQNDKAETDEEFAEDKEYAIQLIQQLPD